mmetsp:Transcript_18032/g.26303  ORF Transcript_18032/g.26303 Transcript_18032/m.26303 type:complete len:231 (+) Transcript_18032:563-1255(+)
MLLPGDRNTTGHGTTKHLVSTHSNGINWLLEGNLGRKVDKGHHHGEQGSIAVDVEPLPGDIQVVENPQNAIKVVHGTLDSRSNIDIDDDGTISILLNLCGENVVVDLAHGKGWDGLGIHPVIPGGLEDTVVRLLGGIKDAVWMAFSCEENSVQVSLGTAGSDIAPVVSGRDVPQVSEEVNDGALELSRVHSVVTSYKGIPEVIDGVFHELVQFLVIVHEVVGVTEMNAGF